MQLLAELVAEQGLALMLQAVSHLLLKIASYFLDKGVDATDCAPLEGQNRSVSPLLLLIELAEVRIHACDLLTAAGLVFDAGDV